MRHIASCIVITLAAATGLTATGCKEKTAKEGATAGKAAVDSPATSAPATPPPAAPASVTPEAPTVSPAAVVDSVYRIHKNGMGPFFDKEGEALRKKYFDSTLVAQIHRNLVGPPNGEVSNLDFDIFYNAQDIEIHDFKIGEADIRENAATVPVTFRNFDRQEKLIYHLTKTSDGWRISNIDYGDQQDLVKILSTPW